MNIKDFIIQLSSIDKRLIYNYEGLIGSLYKLHNMIGMSKVKTSVISQIQYFLVNKHRSVDCLDSHMFHTVVSGPPGCGKTTLVEILTEIWISLGIFQKDNNSTIKEKDLELNKLLLENNTRFDKIKKDIIIDKNKIHEVTKQLSFINYKFHNTEINKLIKKLKSINASINKNIRGNFEILSPLIEKTSDLDFDTEKEHVNRVDYKDSVIKLKRNDLIGKYVGHTAIKTREALMKGINKVIFIDEAYELYNTSEHSSDAFGMECLNTILNFINEYSHKCIIVFAGYKNLLQETIFRVQPGLERRIGWTYEIEEYNMEDLLNIYDKQLKEKNWILNEKVQILNLFKLNKDLFKFGGGDTLRLCMYTKIIYAQSSFDKLINRKEIDNLIGYDIVNKAIKILKENHQNKKEELPYGMYS
jgi:SpoVK/Ycf46/Vps4 family AAA+-type ATPase